MNKIKLVMAVLIIAGLAAISPPAISFYYSKISSNAVDADEPADRPVN